MYWKKSCGGWTLFSCKNVLNVNSQQRTRSCYKTKTKFTWFHVNSKTDRIYEPTVIQMHMTQTH